MDKRILTEAKFSRGELKDMLVGVTGKQARIDALHGYLYAAAQMIAETAGPETAESCLLSTRFSVLGRGSRSLKEASNAR